MKGVGAACLLGVTGVNAWMRSGRARAALLRSACDDDDDDDDDVPDGWLRSWPGCSSSRSADRRLTEPAPVVNMEHSHRPIDSHRRGEKGSPVVAAD